MAGVAHAEAEWGRREGRAHAECVEKSFSFAKNDRKRPRGKKPLAR